MRKRHGYTLYSFPSTQRHVFHHCSTCAERGAWTRASAPPRRRRRRPQALPPPPPPPHPLLSPPPPRFLPPPPRPLAQPDCSRRRPPGPHQEAARWSWALRLHRPCRLQAPEQRPPVLRPCAPQPPRCLPPAVAAGAARPSLGHLLAPPPSYLRRGPPQGVPRGGRLVTEAALLPLARLGPQVQRPRPREGRPGPRVSRLRAQSTLPRARSRTLARACHSPCRVLPPGRAPLSSA